MASILCVQPRNDLRVAPGISDTPDGTQPKKPNPQIVELVGLMRATCLDVADSAANSDIQLANSTICVARALKLEGTPKDGPFELEGLPAELVHKMWGKFVRYIADPFESSWFPTQELSLRSLMSTRVIEYSGAALAVFRADLLRRTATEIPNNLGTLLKYKVTMLEVGQLCHRQHTYLFEEGLVVMSDGDRPFKAIALDATLDHALKLTRLIHLRDLTNIVPSHPYQCHPGYIHGLTFKDRQGSPDLTLGFGDLPTAIAWSTTIRRLQCRNQLEGSDSTRTAPEAEDVAAFESFAALMQVFRWQLADAPPLGRVLCHGLVSVTSRKSNYFIRLVLFESALVFIQGTPPDIIRHLVASRITSIAVTSEKRITFTYLTEGPNHNRFEEFCFEPKDASSDVATWVRALHNFAPNATTRYDAHRKLRALGFKHAQAEAQPSETNGVDKVVVAGLATLHATPMSHELNISVGVLPEFESDGVATHLIAHVLEVAFEKLNAHRVQARVVHSVTDPAQTARAVRVLLRLGFTHEGVRRRATVHPTEGQWADVSVLAMLELDWVTRASVTQAKGTLWDEMFVRHQCEREVLLKLEGSQGLKRTRSMETIRDLHLMNDAVPSASMVASSVGCPTVTSDTASQVSVPTEMSSWDGISDDSGPQISRVQRSNVGSISSADDAADEYEEWDLEEDYSDEDEEDTELKD